MKEPDFILFGGTFDPPHQGHSRLIEVIRQRYRNAKLVIVPSYQPVAASGVEKRYVAPFEARLEMCALAFHTFLDRDLCLISNMEQSLPRPSYTIQTVQAMQSQYYPQQMALLIGQDQLTNLQHWHEARLLFSELDVIVATRSKKNSVTEKQAECVKAIAELASVLDLGHFQASPGEAWFPHRSLRFTILPEIDQDISSSAIRADLAAGRCADLAIDPAVLQYIRDNHYYLKEEI